MEIINEAADKFKDRQEEVCGALLELLARINTLERSVLARSNEINARILKKELSAPEIDMAMKEMWSYFREECRKIVEPRCTEKLLKKGYARSFSTTPMYGYIEDEDDCRGTFAMATAKVAVVEFRFTNHSSVNFMHRFTLVPSGGVWLVDAFSYGNEKEGVWHRGHI